MVLGSLTLVKPPLATARAASCYRRVHMFVYLFVCLFVCLSPNCKKKAISQKLSNLELWSLLTIGSRIHGLFKEPIIGPLKSKMAEIRHLENRHDVIFFCRGWSDWIIIRRLVQNDISTAVIRSKSKPDAESQYGRRLGEFNGLSSQSHLPHCRVLPPGEFSGMSS